MDFYAYPSRALPSSSSVSNFSIGDFVERVKYCFSFAVSTIVGNVFSAIFTFFFALGGYYFCFFLWFLPQIVRFHLMAYSSVTWGSGEFCSTIGCLVEFVIWVEIREKNLRRDNFWIFKLISCIFVGDYVLNV